MLSLTVGAATHPGRVRRSNEDSVITSARFVAVADGMGGHAAGEVASRIAVTCIAELADRPDARPDDVIAAIAEANHRILAHAQLDQATAGMGTTLTGIGLVNVGGTEHWVVYNVGDSRVYRYANGAFRQLTVDHSEVEELRLAGQLTDEEARVYPRRNVVTRSLGSLPAPQPDLWVFPPTPGERFLVCSDGLTLEVEDTDIAEVIAGVDDVRAAAGMLMERALAGGGRDNVSAVVVSLDAATLPDAGVTGPRPQDAPPTADESDTLALPHPAPVGSASTDTAQIRTDTDIAWDQSIPINEGDLR